MKRFTKIIIALALIFGSVAIANPIYAIFNPSGGATYRLRSSIGTTNTTIPLSSFLEPVSNIPYTMNYFNSDLECGTLDPQTSRSEFVSFTGVTQNSDGTAALTGVSRGLGRSYPYTASTTLALAHSGQSIFILSDAPCLFNQYAIKQNNEVITGTWTFNSFPITPSNLVASTTGPGIVQIATKVQTASGTPALVSPFNAYLVIPSSYATSSGDMATTSVVVTQNNGKIKNNFIDLSSYTTQAGFSTSTATSTNVGSFPAYWIGKNVFVATSTGVTQFKVPSGINKVWVRLVGAGGGGSDGAAAAQGAGGGAGGYTEGMIDLTGTTTVQINIGTGGSSGAPGGNGSESRFGIYMLANGGTGGSTTNGGTGGTAGGGFMNLQGGFGQGGIAIAAVTGGRTLGGTNPLGFPNTGAQGCGGGGMGGATGGNGSSAANGCAIISW